MKPRLLLFLLLIGVVALILAVSVPAFLAVTAAALVIIGIPGYFIAQTRKVQRELDNTEEQESKDDQSHKDAA